jgi:large subunit ribosomal protein L3
VYPGKKMAGQLGNKIITIRNSEILFISVPENILVFRGSLPGKKGNLLRIAAVD